MRMLKMMNVEEKITELSALIKLCLIVIQTIVLKFQAAIDIIIE